MSILSKYWRLITALLVPVAYGVARHFIYRAYPIDSIESWSLRDTLMTAPRLTGFLVMFALYAGWRTARNDWSLTSPWKTVAMGLAPITAWLLYSSASSGPYFSRDVLRIGAVTSAMVGIFEEYTFRGPLLIDLGQRVSVTASIFLTSFWFTIFHYEAQPLNQWVAIFLTGVTFCNLRWRGLSLTWLAIIHTIIDSTFFLFRSKSPGMTSAYGLLLDAGLLLCALATFPYSRKSVTFFEVASTHSVNYGQAKRS